MVSVTVALKDSEEASAGRHQGLTDMEVDTVIHQKRSFGDSRESSVFSVPRSPIKSVQEILSSGNARHIFGGRRMTSNI